MLWAMFGNTQSLQFTPSLSSKYTLSMKISLLLALTKGMILLKGVVLSVLEMRHSIMLVMHSVGIFINSQVLGILRLILKLK